MKEVTLEIYKRETIYIAKFETDRTTLTCLKNLKWSFLKAGDSNSGATQGRNYIYWHARSWRQLLQGMKLSILAHQKLTAAIERWNHWNYLYWHTRSWRQLLPGKIFGFFYTVLLPQYLRYKIFTKTFTLIALRFLK